MPKLDQLSPGYDAPLPSTQAPPTRVGSTFRFHLGAESAHTQEIRPLHRCRKRPRHRTRLGSPPTMSELLFKPATELATLVHTGQISSSELVAAALERIEALQPTSTPSSTSMPRVPWPRPRPSAPDDPRPFAGVPIAIKDTAPVAGMPYTMGSDVFGDFVPGHDAFVVRRIRDAGFVIVGKTNMPEFGILPVIGVAPLRPGPQPLGHRPDARRLERRRGRGGGVRDGPARPRQRRRRLDPDPGLVLRPRRAEAHPRTHLARSRPGRRLPGPGRRAHPHGRGDRRDCSTSWPATRWATRPGRRRPQSRSRQRRRASRAGCASATP